MPRTLAIFDLDYTILNGDSEMLWARFMSEKGVVSDDFVWQIERFYEDYEQGKLDGIPAYKAGKVKLLGRWLEKNQLTLSISGYSDSHNDLPL